LSKPDEKSGKTRLQVLRDIKKQTGVVAPELQDLPAIPFGADHIWRWYTKLDGKRTAGFSLNPITWADMQAFFALQRITPQQWELDALCDLDQVFIASRIAAKTGVAKGAKALKARMTGKAALQG